MSDFGPAVRLGAYWSEREAPLEEEIRIAVAAAFPDAVAADEVDCGDPAIWAQSWKLPGVEGETLLAAEERGDDPEPSLATHDDAVERAAAGRARHLLTVESALTTDRAVEEFAILLRLLDAAAVPGLSVVRDFGAALVHSGKRIRRLLDSGTAAPSRILYGVHARSSSHGAWIRTQGVARFGLPEFELWGVDDSEIEAGRALLAALPDLLSGGAEPDEEGVLSVGSGVGVRLVDVDDAMRMMPAAAILSRSAHAEEAATLETLRGGRCCVVAKDRFETPTEALELLADDAAIFKPRAEAERRRAVAESRFGVFGQLFAMRRRAGWRFHVQLAFAGRRTVGREHLWFEAKELKPGRVRARCLSAPVEADDVRRGAEGWFELSRMTDWLVVSPEGAFGPDEAARLLDES